MGNRCETPERLSTRLSSRARNATCSTTSRMYGGTSTEIGDRLRCPSFLRRDVDALRNRKRIVRSNLASDSIFQRRDDLAARRIVFRVRRKDQHHIKRKADRIALDLDIPFLHDVEKTYLNLAGKIGQFIHNEQAPVCARQQAIVNRQFARDVLAGSRRLDRIDVADHVGDGHIRRRQLLDIASLAIEPRKRSFISERRYLLAASLTQRSQRMIAYLASGYIRHLGIEKTGQHASQTASLPVLASREE